VAVGVRIRDPFVGRSAAWRTPLPVALALLALSSLALAAEPTVSITRDR
jgi:hypothetical protein